jgi:prophage DNA circulation protein
VSWRDELRQASFRNVAFEVESHELTTGRRVQLHEYPLRDEPYAEDMGRKARRCSIECFLLGADYLTAAAKLEEALLAEGPGTLVHPWLGTRRVAVDEYRRRETTREGGYVKFSITFVEAGQAAEPDAATDTAWVVDQQADAAQAACLADLPRNFSVAGLSEWVRISALGQLQTVLDDMESIADLAAMPVALAEEVMSDMALFRSEVLGVASYALALLAAPATLAGRVSSLVSGLSGLLDLSGLSGLSGLNLLSGWDILNRYRSLRGYSATAAAALAALPATATASRVRQAQNNLAIAALVERTALVESVRVSSRLSFETYDQAAALRTELAEALDDTAATASDPVYRQLADLRVALVRDLTARGANLARLTTWTPATTLPDLVVAHKIYGDAGRAAEIVSRNRIRRPGAVPGGMPLEVRTDE